MFQTQLLDEPDRLAGRLTAQVLHWLTREDEHQSMKENAKPRVRLRTPHNMSIGPLDTGRPFLARPKWWVLFICDNSIVYCQLFLSAIHPPLSVTFHNPFTMAFLCERQMSIVGVGVFFFV